MRFIIPINVPEENGTMTCHVLETNSTCARTNRRYLREYFLQMGVPVTQLKRVMKEMGFTTERIGR